MPPRVWRGNKPSKRPLFIHLAHRCKFENQSMFFSLQRTWLVSLDQFAWSITTDLLDCSIRVPFGEVPKRKLTQPAENCCSTTCFSPRCCSNRRSRAFYARELASAFRDISYISTKYVLFSSVTLLSAILFTGAEPGQILALLISPQTSLGSLKWSISLIYLWFDKVPYTTSQ